MHGSSLQQGLLLFLAPWDWHGSVIRWCCPQCSRVWDSATPTPVPLPQPILLDIWYSLFLEEPSQRDMVHGFVITVGLTVAAAGMLLTGLANSFATAAVWRVVYRYRQRSQ